MKKETLPKQDPVEVTKELASLATNGIEDVVGFKIGGIIPLSIRYIRTNVHIQLCAIKAEIRALTGDAECTLPQFYDEELQKKYLPLLLKYLEIGLLNDRSCSWIVRPFLSRHLRKLSYYELFFKYFQLASKDDPAYFFVVWTSLHRMDNTISKVEKQ